MLERGNDPVVDTSRGPHARLRSLPLSAVQLDDEFWAPRLRAARQVSLPQQYEQLQSTGRIASFRYAAGRSDVDPRGLVYSDSDLYKWLEAASFALAGERTEGLEQLIDALVADVASAQAPDGYLNTYFSFEREGDRYRDLSWSHELYSAGHLIQAAVAHHRATGKRTLLEVAVRLADHICRTFGPSGRPEPDGHPEIELALVELYRETGRTVYLQRAGFFLDQRGRQPPVLTGQTYMQDHLPVRKQREIVGHAVRALYLACGMADVCIETGEQALATTLEALWQSAFTRKAYITGGLGSHWLGEAVGADYELPNERAYAETCAAIAGAMWNWRMLLRMGEARFADWLEIALYNGVLAGISLDGTACFYQNPLADRGHHRRAAWFACACCPPNVARTLLSLPGLAACTSVEGLWVHLYAQGTVRATVANGEVSLRVQSRYPWDGSVRLIVETTPDTPWSLFLRVPAWSEGSRTRVLGPDGAIEAGPGSYVELRRAWRTRDEVELELPMPIRRVVSHPRVSANTGRVALMRGPLVYCVEAADHPGLDVWDLRLPEDAALWTEPGPAELGGAVAIKGSAVVEEPTGWTGRLYAPVGPRRTEARTTELLAIPYYAWANRAPGPMLVWLPQT